MSTLLRGVAGLIVWAIGFNLLYGVHGLGCARGWDAQSLGPLSVQHGALLATWGATIAAGASLIWHLRANRGFAGRLALAGAATGLVATLTTGAPVVVFPACL